MFFFVCCWFILLEVYAIVFWVGCWAPLLIFLLVDYHGDDGLFFYYYYCELLLLLAHKKKNLLLLSLNNNNKGKQTKAIQHTRHND
jgi:hypothetical protein